MAKISVRLLFKLLSNIRTYSLRSQRTELSIFWICLDSWCALLYKSCGFTHITRDSYQCGESRVRTSHKHFNLEKIFRIKTLSAYKMCDLGNCADITLSTMHCLFPMAYCWCHLERWYSSLWFGIHDLKVAEGSQVLVSWSAVSSRICFSFFKCCTSNPRGLFSSN